MIWKMTAKLPSCCYPTSSTNKWEERMDCKKLELEHLSWQVLQGVKNSNEAESQPL